MHIMKFYENLKSILLSTIDELASDPTLYARNPGKDFTRNRKLSFKQFIQMLLTLEGECLKEELYLFFGRNEDTPSKAAFYKQRQKLHKDALANLLFAFNKKLKRRLYKGKYQLIACDGSSLDIYRNPDDPDTFYETNGKSTKGFNQVHVNALYSILDERYTDLIVQPGRKHNEYSAFCQMVDNAPKDNNIKSIYICDRGYASYNSYAHVIENGQYFLIRVTDKKTEQLLGKSISDITTLDTSLERILSRSQSKKHRLYPERENEYRHISKEVTFDYITDENPEYIIPLRIIRFELSDGKYENLITNLPVHEFHTEDFKELYFMRWNEETAFRYLKYSLCLKALHTKKFDYVIQEVWARAILFNFSSEITKQVKPKENPKRKHKYEINHTEAFKTCRAFLRIHDGTTFDVEAVIASNIEPVRPDRKYKREHRYMKPMTFAYR